MGITMKRGVRQKGGGVGASGRGRKGRLVAGMKAVRGRSGGGPQTRTRVPGRNFGTGR